MNAWVAIILGVVQGLTEFLPVSSSGHLILFERLFGLNGDNLAFNIVVHLGTLFSVVIFYRKKLWGMVKKPLNKNNILLIVATIPTVVIFFLFRDFFEESFNGAYLAVAFFVTAIMLTVAEIVSQKSLAKNMDYKSALIMGAFQGLAILPGVSRSGSTLSSGLVCGVKKQEVADFSFLMSLPIILGSLVLEIVGGGFEGVGVISLILGFITSFVCGYIAIKFMLGIIKDKKLYPFAIYLAVLGLVVMFL